jgi:uncharacterized BrkB/YihY/UPF0761 family membrane protein
MNFLSFENQRKRFKDWWKNNQENVEDELTRVAAVLAIIILSPLLIIVLIAMLIMTINIAELKKIFKNLGEKIKSRLEIILWYLLFPIGLILVLKNKGFPDE